MILVVGATGTVGRKVIDKLLANPQNKVRAIARGKSDWEGSVLPAFRRRGVDVMVGDIRSEASIKRAMEGVKCIINCAGVMRGGPEEDIAEVNIDGVKNLIAQGKDAGVQRFIQLSCLGATEHATNIYLGCKWEADELVKNSGLYWTIFRPSLIFDQGKQYNLYRILEFWIQRSPIILMVGSGLNRFQPICADDIASCVASSVYDRETVNKVYELAGPEILDLNGLLTQLAEHQGRQVRAVKIPSFIGVPLFGLLGKLNPKCPIDSNVMSVMTSDIISDDETAARRKFTTLSGLRFSDALSASLAEAEDEEEPAALPSGQMRSKQISSFARRSGSVEETQRLEASEAAAAAAEAEAPPVNTPEKPNLKTNKKMNFKRKI